MRVSLIIPALNEAECLGPLLAEVPANLLQHIIVVDNGSTDETARVARAAGATVIVEPKRGYGFACAAGTGGKTMTATWLTCKAYYVTPVKRILPPKSGLNVTFPLKYLIIGSVILARSIRFVPDLEVLMRTSAWFPLKCDSLRRHASLNPHPEQVSDPLFQTHPFFDPCDLVQVKYEMLRRVITEGKPVGITVAAFGFSRVTWAQLHKRFEVGGMAGLLPQHKGPRRASKVSE